MLLSPLAAAVPAAPTVLAGTPAQAAMRAFITSPLRQWRSSQAAAPSAGSQWLVGKALCCFRCVLCTAACCCQCRHLLTHAASGHWLPARAPIHLPGLLQRLDGLCPAHLIGHQLHHIIVTVMAGVGGGCQPAGVMCVGSSQAGSGSAALPRNCMAW